VDVDIEVRDVEPQWVLSIRQDATPDGIGAVFQQLVPVIETYREKKGIDRVGPLIGLYHDYREDHVDMEVAVSVSGPAEGEGRIEGKELPAVRAAVATHQGPYETIGQVHEALDAYVHDRGGHGETVREVYHVRPDDDPDPANWRTEVVYPIA
jgi:effector-binding domain-containing protein